MTNAHPMQQFHDVIANVLDYGIRRLNKRTGQYTRFLPGQVLRFDLADGFPAITTKKLAFKSAVGELLGFFRGYDSAAQFRELGCKVWDGNANETPAWLANPLRQGRPDYLGRVYSAQWTDWRDWRSVTSEAEADALVAKGYSIQAYDSEFGVWVLRKGINQLEQILHTLMTDPSDRRMVLTGWRPDEWDQAALPSCHTEYVFTADTENNVLHMTMMMRSYDMGLGFNPTLCGLMLAIMAKLASMTPGTCTMAIADCHCYEAHEPGLREMLSREHFPQPALHLGDSIPALKSVDDIPGVFARIQPEDIQLVGYQSHPAIKMPMAV